MKKPRLNDQRVQMMYKRCSYNDLSVFVILCHGYYELPKDTIRENSINFHQFNTINFAKIEYVNTQLA